jgi:hypothetical protein
LAIRQTARAYNAVAPEDNSQLLLTISDVDALTDNALTSEFGSF